MTRDKNDIYKEVFIILSFFSDDLIEKIPSNVLENIGNLSMKSTSNFYINKEKSLKEQDISEESKDLIALIFYNYIADENEKKEILNLWNENEIKYQKALEEKYNTDNLFSHKIKEKQNSENIVSSNTAMIEYKESLFSKIKNLIKKIMKK